MPPVYDWYWIDARDCAELFVRALRTPEAGGERIIVTSEHIGFQDLLDVANNLTPPVYTGLLEHVLEDDSRAARDAACKIMFNVDKARRILGMGATHQLRKKEVMMRDTLERFKELGFKI